MAAVKNVLLMGASTAIRLASGLLTFAILARVLGPNAFGVLMLWLSVAALIALISNFGFTQYALREIGANQTLATIIMSEVLTAKALVGAILLVLGLIASIFIDGSDQWVFLFLLFAMQVDSMTDFLNVGYRATNRFSVETKIATFSSAIQFVATSATAYLLKDIVWISLSFLVSRLVVLAATWISQQQYFSTLSFSSVFQAGSRLRDASSYALDFGLQSLFGQIDNLVLNQFVGPAAVGIYQSGMRIFLAGTQAAAVIGNVLIPQAASLSSDPIAKRRVNGYLVVTLVTIGLIGGMVFASIPKTLVIQIFGASFSDLSELLIGFGLLFFARFTAAAIGTVLTIQGFQKQRAICTLMHWLFIAAYLFIYPINNTKDWLFSLIIGHVALTLLYSTLLQIRSPRSISRWSMLQVTSSIFIISIATLCYIN